MITVHIWPTNLGAGHWGHASLSLDTDYISWWPQRDGRVLSEGARFADRVLSESVHRKTANVTRSVYSAHPIRSRTLADDIRGEGGAEPEDVELDGLDEKAVQTWWRAFSLHGGRAPGPLPPWHTTDQNCSTVAAQALKRGGGDKYASWVTSWTMVLWTPNDVLDYARSIEKGLRRARRSKSVVGR